MTPYDRGYVDGQNGETNCKYPAGSEEYREYFRGHFEATQDG